MYSAAIVDNLHVRYVYLSRAVVGGYPIHRRMTSLPIVGRSVLLTRPDRGRNILRTPVQIVTFEGPLSRYRQIHGLLIVGASRSCRSCRSLYSFTFTQGIEKIKDRSSSIDQILPLRQTERPHFICNIFIHYDKTVPAVGLDEFIRLTFVNGGAPTCLPDGDLSSAGLGTLT